MGRSGTVTVALLSRPNTTTTTDKTMSDYWFTDVKITRTAPTAEETTFTASVVKNSLGTVNGTSDYEDTTASYFWANVTSNRDNAALNSLTLKVGEVEKGTHTFTNPTITVNTGAGIYFGIIVNDTTINSVDEITMTVE